MDNIAIITFQRNLHIAEKIKQCTRGEIILYSKYAFKHCFEYDAIIAVMAIGIVVRNIAPLIKNKWQDPAIVVVDSGLNFAIPLLGGHHGGNKLAKKLSEIGTIPIITTATQACGKPGVESIAEKLGCKIVNKESTKKVNIALLNKDIEILKVKGPKIIVVDNDVCVLKACKLVIGIGSNKGVTKTEVIDAVIKALKHINATIDDVECFATAMLKQDEKGIIEASKHFGKELRFVSHELINSMNYLTPSKAKLVGLNGACEPSALAVSKEKKLLLRKRIYGNVTIAIAR